MSEENRNNQPQEAEIQETEITEEELSEQRQIRREKLKKLQEAGRNPFIEEKWDVDNYSQDIKDNLKAWKERKCPSPAESWLKEAWVRLRLSTFRISRTESRYM